MEMQSSLVTLKPGMYILRHPKVGMPPLSISRTPYGAGKFEVISTPGTQGAILRDGSDCIVMHVFEAPVEILVTAYLDQAGGVAPTLKIDQIGLDVPRIAQESVLATSSSPKPIEISGTGISVIGHIERTGDVVVSDGKQLGQFGSNLRLEGFQVMWPDKPVGVDLVYGLTLEGGDSTPMVGVGQFCGTRNMARRVTEVTFALTGPEAPKYQLEGIAHFSGGFQTPIVSGIALTGPSGLEHLTSISLRAIAAPAAKQGALNPWKDAARTQVFKPASKSAKASTVQSTTAKSPATKSLPAKGKVARKSS